MSSIAEAQRELIGPNRPESSGTPDPVPRLAVVIALLVVAVSTIQYLGLGFQYYPGDLIDSRLDMYLLEHGYKWLSGSSPLPFMDAPFFYPAHGVIAYSDNFIGQLPFYAPWRALGFSRETAFQIWVAIGFGLNYLAAAWVLRRLRFHWSAVLLGAYIFAFSQAALGQIGHGQLLYRFAVPLSWYFLYCFLEHFSWKDLLACLAFLFWQSCCSLYEGYFLAIFLAAFAVITVITKPVFRQYAAKITPRCVLAHAAVVAVFIVALGALLRPYLAEARDPDLAAVRRQEAITMLPRPVSYLMSWQGNYETGWLFEKAGVPMPHEHLMFVGLIPWACVLFLLLTRRTSGRHPAVIPAILAMFCIVLLTLYVGGASLYLALMRLPGVAGIRGVTRWILVLLLPFSIATGQVIHLWREKLRSLPNTIGIAALSVTALALLLENHVTAFRFSKAEAQQRVRALAAQLPANMPREAILAYLQPFRAFERQPYELDAMLLAQEKNIVTVNGYSSHEPRGYRFMRECNDLKHELDDVPRYSAAAAVRDAAARVVVLGNAIDTPCTHLNSRATIQREPLPERAFRAKIEVVTTPSAHPAEWQIAKVLLTNASAVPWRANGLDNGRYALRIACRWIDSDLHKPLSDYDNRFDVPYDLPPGDTATIPVALKAPAVPGTYAMECDAVQELVHWFRDLNSPVGTTPVTVIDTGPPIEGFLDGVDKDSIAGWVWEKAYPNEPVSVEIYDGDKLLATVPADIVREDLKAAHKGNGAHSFVYPNQLSAGSVHTIHVRIAGSHFELSGSPRNFSRTQ